MAGKRKFFVIPKRKVKGDELVKKSKSSIIRSSGKRLKTKEIITSSAVEDHQQAVIPEVIVPPKSSKKRNSSKESVKGSLYSACVKFLAGFTSSHLIRKKFGNQRILQELQRSTQDNETYGGFFGKQDNWTLSALPEMNLLDLSVNYFSYQPECLLGVGGQGCVFLGKFSKPHDDKSYAFKIRARTKSAINSGTSSSPGRRRSPNFRVVEGRLKEQELFDTNRGVPNDLESNNGKVVNFIDDLQQEALHREAVAAFRVYSQTHMHPKPILYGYSSKLDYEIFVMDIMDFTLNDFIRGTNWKTRMDCLTEVWTIIKESFDNCHQGGVVHYDIKPENLGVRIINGSLECGLLDFGISKTQGYGLDRYCKGATLYRPPGTVDYMSPRSHVWKPMSWMDDFLSSFFTMYIYSVSEGKSSYEKIEGVKKFKTPVPIEERKLMNPESVAIYCLKRPPWARFPYGTNHALKKKQNESIVKEEVSLSMIKIHSLANPRTLDDIVSILLNIDGFLDDTMDVKDIKEEVDRLDFSSRAAQFLQTFITRNLNKFQIWWLDFASEVRRLIDEFWENTPEDQRAKSYQSIMKILTTYLPNFEDIDGLIQNSTCGRRLLEASF